MLDSMDDFADVFALLAKALQRMGAVLLPCARGDAGRAPRGSAELLELLVRLADTFGNDGGTTNAAIPVSDGSDAGARAALVGSDALVRKSSGAPKVMALPLLHLFPFPTVEPEAKDRAKADRLTQVEDAALSAVSRKARKKTRK